MLNKNWLYNADIDGNIPELLKEFADFFEEQNILVMFTRTPNSLDTKRQEHREVKSNKFEMDWKTDLLKTIKENNIKEVLLYTAYYLEHPNGNYPALRFDWKNN
jgi:hypothetical protein